MTTFNDIFKSSFLEKVSSFSLLDMGLAMLLSLLLGLFIFAVYRKTFSGVMYSASFGASLVAMTLVTTLIISLGMVGALSIVRFRTAIKEPMDIAFLFWSISAGIVTGAGLLPLAVLGSLFIGIFLVLFVNKKSTDNPYILVVSCAGDEAEAAVNGYVNRAVKKSLLKSKTVSQSGVELTVEVRLKDMTTRFVNEISALPGVNSAVLVSYNGEYMS